MPPSAPYTIKDRGFWRIVAGLLLASLFIFAALYTVQPLLPVFVDEFDVSVATASLSMSLTVIGLIIGLVLLGFLSDRYGRTLSIKFSLLFAAFPFFLIPLFDSFELLLLFRLIQGFALAGVPAAAIAYMAEEIDRRHVGFAMGLYIASNALGGLIGRVVTGYITDHSSWETTFNILGISGVILFGAIFFLLPASRRFTSDDLLLSDDLKGFLIHLKNPLLLSIFGFGIILQLSFTGIWTFMPFHLQNPPFNLSLQELSMLYFAYGFGVVGSPIAGNLATRYGLDRIRFIAILTLSLGAFLTIFSSFAVIAIGLCLNCLGFFIAHSLTATTVSQKATHHKGSASSLYLVAYYVGVAAGSSLLSPIWTNFGWIGIATFASLLPIFYLFVTIFMFPTNKKNQAKCARFF